jgi:hypothetical protein
MLGEKVRLITDDYTQMVDPGSHYQAQIGALVKKLGACSSKNVLDFTFDDRFDRREARAITNGKFGSEPTDAQLLKAIKEESKWFASTCSTQHGYTSSKQKQERKMSDTVAAVRRLSRLGRCLKLLKSENSEERTGNVVSDQLQQPTEDVKTRQTAAQKVHKKRRICTFFQKGKCRNGDTCKFLHTKKQKKRTICTFFLQRNCMYGARCRFSHD